MTPATLTPWPPDEGSLRIPDPGLTLSETLNIHGAVLHLLATSRADGDAVLESALEKLAEAGHEIAMEHPEEYAAVQAEVEMQKRFGLGG